VTTTKRLRIALATMLGLCLMGKASAIPSECQEAISQYNSALEDISATLRRYASCVSDSRGHDDCSSQFRRLKSAQSDFEDAVSKYGSECN
jgi:hypothetical protein